MIINKYAEIKRRGNKNIIYYNELGYDTTQEVFLVLIEHLTKSSKVIVTAQCHYCSKLVDRKYYLYLKNISSNNLFSCSPKCGKNKSLLTNLEKYGVEYPNQSDIVQNKCKKTNIEKYGVDRPMKSDVVKNKLKENNIKKYGVEYTLQLKDVRDIIKKTNIEKYGVDHNFKIPGYYEDRKNILLEKYGVDNVSKIEEIKDKKRETTLKNYGVDNPMKSDIIRNKVRETTFKNYGVYHHMQNSDIRENAKNTLLEKYGVDHNLKIDGIRDKIALDNFEKYGVKYYMSTDEFKEKSKEYYLEKYGVDSYQKSDEFRLNTIIGNDENYIKYLDNNISLFKCNKGHNFEISSYLYHGRKKGNIPLCTTCYPIGDNTSIKEKELLEFIKSIYDKEVISGYRDGLEIDIYLPELNLGFEFNGLYWHSSAKKDKNYHLDKTKYFQYKGIRIIHIWEDDYDNNFNIIKSQISNLLGKSNQKIHARKCYIKELKTSTDFLNSNHIQGVDKSNIKLGLFYNDELVSVMTFNRLEGRNKMEEGGYNLSRFCNKINTNVIGGASKLLNYFIKTYNPKRIISYADRDWSIGNLYITLGFNLVSESKPDYKYIVDNERKHKQNFKKKNLGIDGSNITESKYMSNLHHKIYDCGKLKYELKKGFSKY